MSRLRKALLALIFVFGLPGSGWAWSFVAASAVDTNAGGGSPSDVSGTTSTVDVPTGTQDNDVLIAVCKYPSTETLTQASFTSLGTRTDAGASAIYNVLWRLASSEPATYAFTIGSGGRFGCSIYSFRSDFNTSDPINEALLSNTAYTTNDTTIRAAAVTTTETNVPIVFLGVGHASSAVTQTTAPQVPAAFAEHDDVSDGTNSRFFRSVSSLLWTGSGATGNMDSVISATATTKHGFAVVLNAAGAAASGPPAGTLRLLGVGK